MKKFKLFILLICLTIPFIFSGCENTNHNTLTAPSNFDVENGVIVFKPIEETNFYTVNINGNDFVLDSKYGTNLKIIDNLVNFDASQFFDFGKTYSIKVKSNAIPDTNKIDSAFTPINSYTHTSIISTPENVQINNNVLTWKTVQHADYYIIRIKTPNSAVGTLEYTYTSNRYDFSSLLSTAGKYEFSVSAVCANQTDFEQSEFSVAEVYTHSQKLQQPEISVSNIDGNATLIAVVEENANQIAINCNNNEKTFNIEDLKQNSEDENLNTVMVNLNDHFTLLENEYYSIKAKAINSSVEQLYQNSDYSNVKTYFNKIKKISAPVLTKNNNSISISENINGVNLYVSSNNTLSTYFLAPEQLSVELSNFDFAFATAVGLDNNNSVISNIVGNNTTLRSNQLSANYANNTLSWDSIFNGVYVLENADNTLVLNTNSYKLPSSSLSVSNKDFNIYAITANGYYKQEYSISQRLETPTNVHMTSQSSYIVKFNTVENAFGYIVHYSTQDTNDYIKHIFTSNTIDLTDYLTAENCTIAISAVPHYDSIYTESNLSQYIDLVLSNKLSAPEFVLTNGLPYSTKIINGTKQYYLNFVEVEGANSYEIYINSSKLIVSAGRNSVNITNYISKPGNYTIKIKAKPNEYSSILAESTFNEISFGKNKQLDKVEEIDVIENDSAYILTFKGVNYADKYMVNIVTDTLNYESYLSGKNLKNNFYVKDSCDISEYLQPKGNYKVYLTAVAGENSAYTNSDISETYAPISKNANLNTPSLISFENVDKETYTLNFKGDTNASGYLLSITDPNNISYKTTISETSANISEFLTLEGEYKFTLRSLSNNSNYLNSSFKKHSLDYSYVQSFDFERYEKFLHGKQYSSKIESAEQLTYVLWHHYLYGNQNQPLSLYIEKSIEDVVADFSKNPKNNPEVIYSFHKSKDPEWDSNYKNRDEKTKIQKLAYVCEKLLNSYWDLNALQGLEIYESDANSNIYQITFANALNTNKTTNTKNVLNVYDYSNAYVYPYENLITTFEIDTKEEMIVETTEQLLHAVENNFKPKFFGDYTTAETVYNNAKLVASSIITNNMSDFEKATAIFDWLSSSFTLNLYADKDLIGEDIYPVEISKYGLREDFYLEKTFLNISNPEYGGFDGKFYLGNRQATSNSYSKSFALLCSIVGIETKVIHGTYTYSTETFNHTWNKININDCWFVVDLTFSDNIVKLSNFKSSYGLNSHLLFLVSDDTHSYILQTFACNDVKPYVIYNNMECYDDYDYYSNATYNLTGYEIKQVVPYIQVDENYAVSYKKSFVTNGNNNITDTSITPANYGELQTYIYNLALKAASFAKINNYTTPSEKHLASIEFTFDGTQNIDISYVNSLFRNLTQSDYNIAIEAVDCFKIARGFNSQIIILTFETI